MITPDFSELKNKPVYKTLMGILIMLLIIKAGKLGYELGQWLR
ncbi:hypothetical protein [Mucilaginibacter sp. SP1R1]|nr:hypothetical protein [Mucilaginibacter sp. SP1R1]MBB6152003.1 hypothetical protein [Mucilaginibacter sp. SP1R1]